jgi:hypothetical protein
MEAEFVDESTIKSDASVAILLHHSSDSSHEIVDRLYATIANDSLSTGDTGLKKLKPFDCN